jgi:hypothetical protein
MAGIVDQDAEPGDEPDAPYQKEHCAADIVERFYAMQAGLSWKIYTEDIDDVENIGKGNMKLKNHLMKE